MLHIDKRFGSDFILLTSLLIAGIIILIAQPADSSLDESENNLTDSGKVQEVNQQPTQQKGSSNSIPATNNYPHQLGGRLPPGIVRPKPVKIEGSSTPSGSYVQILPNGTLIYVFPQTTRPPSTAGKESTTEAPKAPQQPYPTERINEYMDQNGAQFYGYFRHNSILSSTAEQLNNRFGEMKYNFFCIENVTNVRPTFGVTQNGVEVLVVNTKKYRQELISVKCLDEGKKCNNEWKCEKSYYYQTVVAQHPNKSDVFYLEHIRLESGCKCASSSCSP